MFWWIKKKSKTKAIFVFRHFVLHKAVWPSSVQLVNGTTIILGGYGKVEIKDSLLHQKIYTVYVWSESLERMYQHMKACERVLWFGQISDKSISFDGLAGAIEEEGVEMIDACKTIRDNHGQANTIIIEKKEGNMGLTKELIDSLDEEALKEGG